MARRSAARCSGSCTRRPDLSPQLPRYAPAAADALNDAQRAVFDQIAAGPRGRVLAPHRLLIASPRLADIAQRMGAFLRYDSSLRPSLSELAILVVARHWSADYEWAHHRPLALQVGVPPSVVDALENDEAPQFDDDQAAALHAAARMLLTTGRLDDATFVWATTTLGDEGFVDLIGILGYYSMLAMLLNAYETPSNA